MSNASAPATSVDGPVVGDVVPLHHRQRAGGPGGERCDRAAYHPRGHCGVSAPASMQQQRTAEQRDQRRQREPADLGPDESADVESGRAAGGVEVIAIILTRRRVLGAVRRLRRRHRRRSSSPWSSSSTSCTVGTGASNVVFVLDVGDQRVDARLDAIEHRLRIDADEHDRREERQQHQPSFDCQLAERLGCPRRARRGTPAGTPTAGRAQRGSRRRPRRRSTSVP